MAHYPKGRKTILRAYQYRIYPTAAQAEQIDKTIGCARFVYNLYLNAWNTSYKLFGKGMSYNTCATDLPYLKEDHPWLKEADSIALQSACRDLADAFDRFFNEQNNKPVFRKKGYSDSYTTKNSHHSIRVNDHNHLLLPKLGLVRFANSREIQGRIIRATVRKSSAGRYYISILCEDEINEMPTTGNSVGLDLGLKEFAILSDGTKINNPRYSGKMHKKLCREQRKLSRRALQAKKSHRKLSESSNYQKQRTKVAKLYEHVMNQRRDFEQKLSTELIKNHDVICIEDLNVKGMMRNHKSAFAIADVSWSEFVSMLEYKADWYGRKIQKVSRWYPSSQTCHVCGVINPITKDQKIRSWVCPACGAHHDRDINAAINIETEGLRLIGLQA